MADTEITPIEAVEPVAPVEPEAIEPDAPVEPAPVDPAELERLRTALAKANKEAEKHRLAKKVEEDAKLSEIERAKRDADEATQELARFRADNLRQKVALDAGLPAKWVGRLQGDSEEELQADALSILADLNKTRQPAPDPSQGPRTSVLTADDQFFESIYGKQA